MNEGYVDERVLLGEKFEMIYDSLHPDRSKIFTYKPFFTDYDFVLYTIGIIYDVVHRNNYTGVYFDYDVNGVHYKKYQLIHGKIPLRKGERFEIGYIEESPQLSIIYIDKRIPSPSLK